MFFLIILSGVLAGITEVLMKKGTEEKFRSESYLFVMVVLGAIFSLPFFLFDPKVPTSFWPWLWILITSIGYVFGNIFLISSYKLEDLSNIVLVSRVSIVISFFAGVLLFQEKFGGNKVLGIVLILIAILSIFWERKKVKSIKGLLFALAAGTGYSLAFIGTTYSLEFFSPFAYILFPYLGVALITVFFPKVLSEAKQIAKSRLKILALSQLTSVGGYFLFLVGISKVGLSVGNPINESMGVLTPVVLGMILFKERARIGYKIVGLLLLLLGVYLIYQ